MPNKLARKCGDDDDYGIRYGIVRHSALWLKPALVGQFEFLEWTPDDHLRHTRFIGLRDDKKPSDVTREPTS